MSVVYLQTRVIVPLSSPVTLATSLTVKKTEDSHGTEQLEDPAPCIKEKRKKEAIVLISALRIAATIVFYGKS